MTIMIKTTTTTTTDDDEKKGQSEKEKKSPERTQRLVKNRNRSERKGNFETIRDPLAG